MCIRDSVYSEKDRGTTFKIYLPLIDAEDMTEISIEEPLIKMTGTETILIAEDEPEIRNLYKSTLESFGYTVIEAGDGEEAVKLFTENKDKIQLLIFDVVMPKKNGKEAYDEIKSIKPNIEAIFTSGYAENIIYKKGILDENLNFIKKPISPNELLRRIRKVLDS
ncbi:MAG: response regulator, partial [Thermodesulfovibrionales bacterium]|nr:response regulator [Thermodesulfovibrionales bacterium]